MNKLDDYSDSSSSEDDDENISYEIVEREKRKSRKF